MKAACTSFFNKKSGFTLAEVLITLGIIGVVAALVLPGIITNHRKKEVITKLKKAYNVTSQAHYAATHALSEADPDAIQNNAQKYFKEYWEPYILITKKCKTYKDCGYASNTPWKYMNGTKSSLWVMLQDTRVAFITNDGVIYIVYNSTQSGTIVNTARVLVDINGAKAPNKYGEDVFFFDRLPDGAVSAYGNDKNDSQIKTNCSKSSRGDYCLARILRAGWEIPSDYPIKF